VFRSHYFAGIPKGKNKVIFLTKTLNGSSVSKTAVSELKAQNIEMDLIFLKMTDSHAPRIPEALELKDGSKFLDQTVKLKDLANIEIVRVPLGTEREVDQNDPKWKKSFGLFVDLLNKKLFYLP
jgi:hypothetical protein